MPLLEQRIESNAAESIASVGISDVALKVTGYTAQLNGSVANETERNALVTAVKQAKGVRRVKDNLKLAASTPGPAPESSDTPDTSDTSGTSETSETSDTSDTPDTENTSVTNEANPTTNENGVTENVTETETLPVSADSQSLSSEVADENPGTNQPVESQTGNGSAETAAGETTEKPTTRREEIKPQEVVTELPEVNVSIDERTLNVTGRVNNQKDLRPIIESMMTTYDLNYVSNKATSNTNIDQIVWTSDFVAVMPQLESLQNPAIDIFEDQITVSGVVESAAVETQMLNELSTKFPNMTVIDRIRTDSKSPTLNSSNEDDDTTEDPDQTSAGSTETAMTNAEKSPDQQVTPEVDEGQKDNDQSPEAGKTESADTNANNATGSSTEPAAPLADSTLSLVTQADSDATGAASEDPINIARRELSDAFLALRDTRVLFVSGSNRLTSDSQARLDTIAKLLQNYPLVPIAIKGHTDSQGNEEFNLSLSQSRANAVRDYLAARGISVFRLSSFGYGESLPIAPNDTSEGRAINRRIEFSFR